MIILRKFNRTEHDDFALNISHQLSSSTEAMPLYGKMEDNTIILVGWKIQNSFN